MKKFWRKQLEIIIAEIIVLISDYYNDLLSPWVVWFTIAIVIIQFPISYFYEKHKIKKAGEIKG